MLAPQELEHVAKTLGGAAQEWVASQRLALLSREAGGYAPAGREVERPSLEGGGAALVSGYPSAARVIPGRVNAQIPPQAQESCGGPQPILHFFMRTWPALTLPETAIQKQSVPI